MPAHEQVDRHQGGKGQQQPHQHGRHGQIAHGGVGGLARVGQISGHIGRQGALLRWQVHDLTRGPEAPQKGIHREGHDAQHDNFSEGVEAPEVHQHHVDHVGATALAQCPLQEEGGGAFREGAAHHGQRQHRHAPAGRYGQGHVTPAAQQGASLLRLRGGAQIFVTLR